MTLYEIIRSAGQGKFLAALGAKAGIGQDEAAEALRAMLPEIGSAIRATEESGSGAAAMVAAMHDERYGRYLEQPATIKESQAIEDGERVLDDVLEEDERNQLIRRVAAAIGPNEGEVRTMLPLVATLAMAALGQRLRDATPEMPWFGSRPDDKFDGPLINALTALFEHKESKS